MPRCSLLITQLHGEGVNGLSLAATLSDTFAGLQTMFLPDYAAEEQRLDIPGTKIFPEPIDGETLLSAIARAEAQRQTGMDLFHALDVLQMCCLSGRSGAVQLVKGSQTAIVFLLSGRIVHAERGTARGAEALYELVPWEAVEFAYDYSVRAPVQTDPDAVARSPHRRGRAPQGASRRRRPSANRESAARHAPLRHSRRKPVRWGILAALSVAGPLRFLLPRVALF